MIDHAPWLPPAVLLPTLAVLGLLVGSFLNVVVHRLPRMLERDWLTGVGQTLQDDLTMQRVLPADTALRTALAAQGRALEQTLDAQPPLNLSQPRSRCPHCGHGIRWYENIPVLSWLALRARCSACKAPISWRYPLVELVTAVLFTAAGAHALELAAAPGGAASGLTPLAATQIGAAGAGLGQPLAFTALWCVALALLLAAALIDLDTTLLPDELTLPLMGLGLLGAWQGWTGVRLDDAALGLLFGYGGLWALAFVYRLIRGVEGMAEGDFKLLGALGALLGWQSLPDIVLLSSAVGAAVGITLIVARGHDRQVPIPFGPYLAGGGIAALFFGPTLLFGPLVAAAWTR
ncbi:MAG: hypothetical protein RLY78_2879 [Pseudomonadota bacterium]|jgi:leader peptidase (prepilin peptidase)/N-methyltransferase